MAQFNQPAADENPYPVKTISGPSAATGTVTSVDSGIAAVTILAANTSRKGATIFNSDANALYILMASTGTVSSSLNSGSIASGAYFNVPFGYTGLITGVWAGDGAGAAKVTEFA